VWGAVQLALFGSFHLSTRYLILVLNHSGGHLSG
jgi:hypothetical protein